MIEQILQYKCPICGAKLEPLGDLNTIACALFGRQHYQYLDNVDDKDSPHYERFVVLFNYVPYTIEQILTYEKTYEIGVYENIAIWDDGFIEKKWLFSLPSDSPVFDFLNSSYNNTLSKFKTLMSFR